MADTAGLMKTRGEWTDAVASGETTLPHSEWYDQKYGQTESAKAELAKKQVRAGYNKEAAASKPTKTSVA